MLPSIPNWDGFHPILVHFPIALLLVAPLSIVATVIFEKHARVLSVVTFTMILIGTAAAFMAEQTGEAAMRSADIPAAAERVMESHEDLAELTVKIFAALLIVNAAITASSLLFDRITTRGIRVALNIGFLMLYLGASVMLAKTAHAGGTLVHQFGVRNVDAVQASPVPNVALIQPSHGSDHDD